MLSFTLILLCILLFLISGPAGYSWTIFTVTLLATAGACLSVKKVRYHIFNPGFAFPAIFVIFLLSTIVPVFPTMDSETQIARNVQNITAERFIHQAAEIGLSNNSTSFFSISRNRSGTARMLLLIIASSAIGVCAFRFPAPLKMRWLITTMLIGTAMAVGGYVSQHILPQHKSIWWLFSVPHGRPVGCFLNRNHFGGYLAMLAPIPIAFIIYCYSKRKPFCLTGSALSLVMITFALVRSQSRGAWLAFLVSVTASLSFGLLSLKKKAILPLALTGTTLAIGLFLSLNADFHKRILELREDLSSFESTIRFQTWRNAVLIAPDYFVAGTGLNGFEMVFPQYRKLSTRKSISHVENEYIELPLELGLAGTILFLASICFVIRQKRSESNLSSASPSLQKIIIYGSTTAVLTHAFFDFSIRSPIYLITYTSILGCCMLSGEQKRKIETQTTIHASWIWLTVASITVLLTIFAKPINDYDNSDWLETAGANELTRALRWSPTSWQTWYYLGRTALASGKTGAKTFGEKCITQATRYDPKNYLLWKELCMVRLTLNDRKGALDAHRQLRKLRSWVKIPGIDIE